MIALLPTRPGCEHGNNIVAMNQITPAQLAERLQQPEPPALLDVREPDEHGFVALPDSTLIPLGDIAGRVEEIDGWKDREIVVYCHHGIRSMHAIAFLRTQGFKKLLNLAGGIDRWSREVDSAAPRY